VIVFVRRGVCHRLGLVKHIDGVVETRAAVRVALRCGGQTAVGLAQRERDGGQLVCGVVDPHQSCGGSVAFNGGRTRQPGEPVNQRRR